MLDLYGRGEPADPVTVSAPYLAQARNGHNYRNELGGQRHHRELAEALHKCVATVVLCGYPSDLYDRELYPGWYRHTECGQPIWPRLVRFSSLDLAPPSGSGDGPGGVSSSVLAPPLGE